MDCAPCPIQVLSWACPDGVFAYRAKKLLVCLPVLLQQCVAFRFHKSSNQPRKSPSDKCQHGNCQNVLEIATGEVVMDDERRFDVDGN